MKEIEERLTDQLIIERLNHFYFKHLIIPLNLGAFIIVFLLITKLVKLAGA